MELAKITLRGQITIPVAIRKKLGVKDGDKVVFIEENGRIIMENSAGIALKTVRSAFRDETKLTGSKDAHGIGKELRHKKREKSKGGHARY